ncbi:ATP-binding protein, partial [Streptomyces sp. NPDC023588]
LWTEFARELPVILGSVLDLAVSVRAAQADIPTDLRMADFAHLCAQLDAARSFGALDAYRASLDDLNDDVIEGDLLAQTVLKHAADTEPGDEVRMTSAEWLHALTQLYTGEDFRPQPKGWPTTGKVLSDRLKRLQPVLAARGVLVDWGRTRAARYIAMARPQPPQDEQQDIF